VHECLVPMIPRLTLGGPEGEPHGETATSALTGEATFSCILCFYKYFSTVGFTTSRGIPYVFLFFTASPSSRKTNRPIRAGWRAPQCEKLW